MKKYKEYTEITCTTRTLRRLLLDIFTWQNENIIIFTSSYIFVVYFLENIGLLPLTRWMFSGSSYVRNFSNKRKSYLCVPAEQILIIFWLQLSQKGAILTNIYLKYTKQFVTYRMYNNIKDN